MLIREALTGRNRDNLQISVKFGALRDPAMSFGGIDCRPVAVKNFLAYSLQRLGVETIDIYRPARLDPSVPIEETVGAIADRLDTSSTSDCRRSGRTPFAGRTACTRSSICRSNIR
jgi:pyridoxine 4-dehydrogenase